MDVKDNRGWMPLHEAAYNGHTDCIDLLLKQGKHFGPVVQKLTTSLVNVALKFQTLIF